MGDYYNPLQTYSVQEVAELMHATREVVAWWLDTKILQSSKTGKSRVVTSRELALFQEAIEGLEVSNLKKIMDNKSEILRRKKAAQALA